jgi:GH35 family endo-1,4-beta-xylanase
MRRFFLTYIICMCSLCVTAQTLKDAYSNYFRIGVAVNQRNVTNPAQMQLIRDNFNSITAENDMKPQLTCKCSFICLSRTCKWHLHFSMDRQ